MLTYFLQRFSWEVVRKPTTTDLINTLLLELNGSCSSEAVANNQRPLSNY